MALYQFRQSRMTLSLVQSEAPDVLAKKRSIRKSNTSQESVGFSLSLSLSPPAFCLRAVTECEVAWNEVFFGPSA